MKLLSTLLILALFAFGSCLPPSKNQLINEEYEFVKKVLCKEYTVSDNNGEMKIIVAKKVFISLKQGPFMFKRKRLQ